MGENFCFNHRALGIAGTRSCDPAGDNAGPPRTRDGPGDCGSRAHARPRRPGGGDARRYDYQARDPGGDETCRVKDGARSADENVGLGIAVPAPTVRRWALEVAVQGGTITRHASRRGGLSRQGKQGTVGTEQ
jgi:hypothetical protein